MATSETVYALFRATAERERRDAVLYSRANGEWRALSHETMLRRVRHISLALHAAGIVKGDRVAILSESRPEWTLVDLGVLGAGAVLVPIYPTVSQDSVEYILRDSAARLCFVSNPTQFDKVAAAREHLPGLCRVVMFDADTGEAAVPTLAAFEAEGAELDVRQPALAEKLAGAIESDDLASLIYTSGTTGQQKGVMLTHRNLYSNVTVCFTHSEFFSADDIALSYLPLSHIFERMTMYGYLNTGNVVYFARSFETLVDDLQEVRPTVMTSVPRFYEKLYGKICEAGRSRGGVASWLFERALRRGDAWARAAHAGDEPHPLLEAEYPIHNRLVFNRWRAALGGRMRVMLSGGAPLAPDIAYAFLAAGLPIFEGYGLTETSPVISVNTPSAHRIGTVGKPLDTLEVRIAEDGEILVRGPSVMRGYFNLPEATTEAFSEDGFFRTGDIGHLDQNGFLVITDRKKDLIKTSGGKYVAPQPIENAIKASNLVSQVVVLGDKRKYCTALVVPNFEALRQHCADLGIDPGSAAELAAEPKVARFYEQLVDRLTPGLARFEKIKRVGILPGELTIESGELTPTLKVKRRVVEERYRDLIDSLYETVKEVASA
jgi:long-chain acyl-CoA synthetase